MNRKMVGVSAALAVAAAGFGGAASGATTGLPGYGDSCLTSLPQGSEEVVLNPANFVATVDNRYWPMTPGNVWVSRESDVAGRASRVRVEVLTRTKPILGIAATVVHDTLRHRGQVVENTFDWYAQDTCGNVWYLGEKTSEYRNGQVVSRAGSWETGVHGAQAGIALPGAPAVGLKYRQEYSAGEAEDAGEVLSLGEQAQVPAGHFRQLLLTKDTTALHPGVLEYKFYAKGVGPVLAIGISGGSDREELLRFRNAAARGPMS